MTRLLHTGDTHLGYQQYHLPERREDFQSAFGQVVADAVADDVDAVVHAGDLFHDRQPSLSDILGAVSVLENLRDAGIPFFAIVGNHESKRDVQWLDLFESMGLTTRLGAEPTVVGDVALYGLDFVPRAQRDALEYEFESHDADAAALVSHGLFEPFPHGDWDVRKILRESPVEFDAVLLGDDHEAKTKRLDDPYDSWVTYCGSTERASAAETEARGYNVVQFDGDVDIRRRGLETRDFVFVDVELGSGEGADRVREQVDQHELADAVVIVKIRGEGEPVMPATIEEFATGQGALTARVTDEREQPEENEVEVSFADPDDAVRERVGELGLSTAARDIDETIRASSVADSNVDDIAQSHVAELVEKEDPSVFEPAPDDEEAESGDSPDSTGEHPESVDSESESSVSADTIEKTATNDDATDENEDDDPPKAESEPAQEQSDETDEQSSSSGGSTPETDSDGQVSMEDYL